MQGLRQLFEFYCRTEHLHSDQLVLNKIYRWVPFTLKMYKLRLMASGDCSADRYGAPDAAQPAYFDRSVSFINQLPSEALFHSEGFNAMGTVVNLNETLRACIHALENAISFWFDAEVSSYCGQTSRKGRGSDKTKSGP